jgi:hypothetical protein
VLLVALLAIAEALLLRRVTGYRRYNDPGQNRREYDGGSPERRLALPAGCS